MTSAPTCPQICVVIPTYNRRESLERCLLGILACDVAGLSVELRVVDDGSSDGTGECVERLIREHPGPIRIYYHRQNNRGAGPARNLGVRASTAELLLFIDDDCVPDPGWIRELSRHDWSGGAGAVGGRIVSAATRTTVSRYCRFIRFNEFPPDDGPLTFVNTANAAYLRRAVAAVGGFEALFTSAGGEDHDLARSVALAGYRLEYHPEAIVHHFHREDLRTFARAFWIRGYATKLRLVLWGDQPFPTWSRFSVEVAHLALRPLLLLLLPFQAARLVKRGVPAADALPFAFFAWLEAASRRIGRAVMTFRMLTGRQSLDRASTPVSYTARIS